MKVAITGATGLIGENLLFEVIKQNRGNLEDLKIIVLGRSKGGMDIYQRIREIIFSRASALGQPGSIKEFCRTGIKAVHIDLEKEKLGLTNDEYRELKKDPIDFFFHLAALTDLRSTPKNQQALSRTNVCGTRQILELVSSLKVKEFCYTGTAYSCGNIEGNVKPDYINLSNGFRNPYEKTKLEAELLVRDFSKRTKTRCRYFRPSVTCGRLIETPLGAANKFDVFYGWAAFFLQIKMKNLNEGQDIYQEPLALDMRICYSLRSGLNIVPADFAAKAMYQACIQGDPGESYYLANNQETPHKVYIGEMLKFLNITGPRQVDTVPSDMNQLEQLYYKVAGKIFTPYITAAPILFDVSGMENVLRKGDLSCPAVDGKTFPLLMEYAKKKNFGIYRKNVAINVMA